MNKRELLHFMKDMLFLKNTVIRHMKRKPKIEIKKDKQGLPLYLDISNFTLPKSLGSPVVEMVLLVNRYPDEPPRGVFIRADSATIGKVKSRLAGHTFPKAYYKQPEVAYQFLEREGYSWLCFMYANHKWGDMKKSGFLTGYFMNILSTLS